MSKRKLLLADDSITIQKVVNLTFADEGIEVIAVGDGDSAMRKFDEFMPDLVMADVNMPGINGYEMCRIIKRTEETQHIPVILLVGSFEPFDEAEAGDAGADDFLTKPFQSIRQLVNKVTDLLNRKVEIIPEEPAATVDEKPVDSFADTLEIEDGDGQAAEFGDAGMDDEMIEASAAKDYDAGASSFYQPAAFDDAGAAPSGAGDEESLNHAGQTAFASQTDDEAARTSDAKSPFENDEPVEDASSAFQFSETPSFEEEARKLGGYADDDQNDNLNEYTGYQETNIENEPDNLSETEPQVDYHLETEPRFDKEMTDAETLEPDVSYEPEPPREADFSQSDPTENGEDEFFDAAADEAEDERSAPIVDEQSAGADSAGEMTAPAVFEEESATQNEDDAETESPSFETTKNYSFASPEDNEADDAERPAEAATSFETADEELSPAAESADSPAAEETETRAAGLVTEMPAAESDASSINFDDGDLLDLPPLVEETGIRPPFRPEPVVPEIVAPPTLQAAEPESKFTLTKTVAESEIAVSFPPELIEAIAQKVADKISDKTMREILPQITELVMQKMAERREE